MAPGSQWVACKGCFEDGSCSEIALLRCGQWTLCPTLPDGQKPNCSMAPHLSSNSWGYPGGNKFLDDILTEFKSLEIVAVFAIGNEGPECEQTRYPGMLLFITSNISSAATVILSFIYFLCITGESPLVIGVGATSLDDSVTGFSSPGPTFYGNTTIKPDLSAPGENVCSASIQSDNGYIVNSGTSMACPHVAGLTALLLSKDTSLQIDQLKECMLTGAQRTKSSGGNCEAIPDNMFPNHHAGHGRISAKASFEKCFV